MSRLNTPTAIRSLCERFGLYPKKRLGQHFLWKTDIVEKIIVAAELQKDDVVVEIGPGLGILTISAALQAAKVLGLELDRQLFPILEEVLSGCPNVHLIQGNALEIDFARLIAAYAPETCIYKIIGNLPYYLSTSLLTRLLEEELQANLLVLMLQKEVAERLVASPGGKDYGSLSILTQYYSKAELLFSVSNDSFYPQPKVASAVVRLRRRRQPPVEVPDEKVFFKLVRASFHYRRKTLRNALREAGLLTSPQKEGVFEEAGIDPNRRGESLSLEEFAELAKAAADLERR